jgi:hypothetical protein
VASEYIDLQAKRFRNPGSIKNTRLLLLKHPAKLADTPTNEIGSAHIDAALRPLRLESPEQAKRAVACVLKFARAKGHVTASAADIRDDLKVKWARAAGPVLAAVNLEGRLLVVLYQAAKGSVCCRFCSTCGPGQRVSVVQMSTGLDRAVAPDGHWRAVGGNRLAKPGVGSAPLAQARRPKSTACH